LCSNLLGKYYKLQKNDVETEEEKEKMLQAIS